MKSKVGKTLLKIPLIILLSPYYLIKGIGNGLRHLLKSLKFSIRRKITANYLTLYLVVSAMTFILMVFGFMKAELSEKSYEIYTYVDTIVGKYEEGIYDLPKMEQRISSVAEIENCGIQLTFYNSNQIFKSDRYHA
ncbi:MAG: hypothetical protein H7X94_07850, partial [Vallitaleaceae bacterium]|nr:hypothetical protein [Vallitaleaceae bacterium]